MDDGAFTPPADYDYDPDPVQQWEHTIYGHQSGTPTLEDVIVKMHQRCLEGKAPSLTRVDAVRLLDFFSAYNPPDCEMEIASVVVLSRAEKWRALGHPIPEPQGEL